MVEMKAAVLYGNEDIRYDDFKTPEVTPGTVKVRIRATGICGSDVPRVLHHGAHFYPVVLGHEFSGDVVEVGEGVKNIQVGDTVSGAPLLPCMKCADCQSGNYSLCKNYSFIGSREQGSFAEYVVMPEENAIKYDPSIPYEQAAMFEPSTVALHGLYCNDYQGGDYVAVLGGGTIGLFTAQWARVFGAKKVVVFDLVQSRLELAKKLGADEVIVNFDFYNVEVFNQCENNNCVLMAIDSWRYVHPLLKILPVDWDYTIPFGLLHSSHPSPVIQKFLYAVEKAAE